MANSCSWTCGDRVIVHNLETRREFNGSLGTVTGTVPETARLVILLHGGKRIAVRAANLMRADTLQVMRADTLQVTSPGQVVGHNRMWRRMVWTPAQEERFRMEWVENIWREDGAWCRANAQNNDIYIYLLLKLKVVLNKPKIGQAGWEFRQAPMHALRCGCLWAQGGREQEREMQPNEPGRWWPIPPGPAPRSPGAS